MQLPLQEMTRPLQNMLQLSRGPQLATAQLRTVWLGQCTVVAHAAAVAERVVAELAASRAAASNRTLDSERIIDSSFESGFLRVHRALRTSKRITKI
jgi:hypothetical protein